MTENGTKIDSFSKTIKSGASVEIEKKWEFFISEVTNKMLFLQSQTICRTRLCSCRTCFQALYFKESLWKKFLRLKKNAFGQEIIFKLFLKIPLNILLVLLFFWGTGNAHLRFFAQAFPFEEVPQSLFCFFDGFAPLFESLFF